MADAPKLHAYVVTLSFEDGPTHTSVMIAPDATIAAVLATLRLTQKTPVTTALIACFAYELVPDQLRHLLRAVEGHLPASGTADVLSLVPKHIEAQAGQVNLASMPQDGPPMNITNVGDEFTIEPPWPPGAA